MNNVKECENYWSYNIYMYIKSHSATSGLRYFSTLYSSSFTI